MALERNTRLESVIRELGWSQDVTAARLRQVAAEAGADELLTVTRSHISQWLRGVNPRGRAPAMLCEALSRGLRRVVTLAEIGLTRGGEEQPTPDEWGADTVSALVDLGDSDMISRRQLLGYSVLGAVLPPSNWWDDRLEQAGRRTPVSPLAVTGAHVDSLREAMTFFSSRDQRLGGRAGRASLRAYLQTDVATYLASRLPNEPVRRDLFSAAGELTYLDGWMAFDSGDHAAAQHSFRLALTLAAEADDTALAGHILRAQAHQAVDLGHPTQALQYADASMDSRRYGHASSRERSLLGVVHARALAAAGRKRDALAALRRAEDDLGNSGTASDTTAEPGRVSFFGEASLAHETACTLRDLGDLKGAEAEFERSVRTRPLPYARTHAVTLGYLGAVQVRQGHVDAACRTWNRALDSMAGIQSGRARDTVVQMRQALSPVRGRGGSTAAELDHRAMEFLRAIG
ncbi:MULTISPECIES: Tat pathway signal protein [unclassified Kitasatospora]|uniref:Tat pathway signal protein n=1 Tax=unclassified Kitasatospora TaxID=2633591 RepID=UPI0024751EC8|nr:Tat pathway signal protein [Kitasatospora sp. MAP12-44]